MVARNIKNKSNMDGNLYFVYALDENGYVMGEKKVTDSEHLEKCVESVCRDNHVKVAHVNKAEMCFDGYLVQGNYEGRYNII